MSNTSGRSRDFFLNFTFFVELGNFCGNTSYLFTKPSQVFRFCTFQPLRAKWWQYKVITPAAAAAPAAASAAVVVAVVLLIVVDKSSPSVAKGHENRAYHFNFTALPLLLFFCILHSCHPIDRQLGSAVAERQQLSAVQR
jgi:hypothetical protein